MNVTLIGKKVAAGLQKAHRIRHAEQKAQAKETIAMVFRLAKLYQDRGYSHRGLAGRISRHMGGKPGERHVRKILSALLSVGPISQDYTASKRLEVV
jgi:hypothetical protein